PPGAGHGQPAAHSPAHQESRDRAGLGARRILEMAVAMKRLLICGDRRWTDLAMILEAMRALPGDTVIIEGEAAGADSLARLCAEARSMRVLRFPADWKRYGRAAGPIRNRQMLDEGRPDEVWAFHDDLANSKGTADMIAQATRRNVPVRVFSHVAAVPDDFQPEPY